MQVFKAHKATQAHKAQPVTMVLTVQLAQPVRKAHKAHKATQVHKALPVMMVLKVQ